MEESNTRILQLSDLPDSILIEILSKLPTNDAAITTFLSRRWRFLWRAITRLEFNESDHFPGKRRCFLKFVDTVLKSREQEASSSSSLVSFSLKCNVHFVPSRINAWIVAAVSCKNLQELSLSLGGIYHEMSPYILPSCVFMCGTLTKLTLDIKTMLKVAGDSAAFCLFKINYLKLRGIEFADDESVEKLMSCPLLEEMILESCYWNNIKNIRVSAPMTIIDDSEGRAIGDNTNLQELSFSLGGIYYDMSPYILRSCIFMCGTLTKVHLDMKCILKVPAASSFCLAKINYLLDHG